MPRSDIDRQPGPDLVEEPEIVPEPLNDLLVQNVLELDAVGRRAVKELLKDLKTAERVGPVEPIPEPMTTVEVAAAYEDLSEPEKRRVEKILARSQRRSRRDQGVKDAI